MAEIDRRRPLLESIVAAMRLPWYAATGVVAAGLVALLALAFLLEGPVNGQLTWGNLRGPMLPLAIVLYVLAIYPIMARFKQQAIASLRLLLDADAGSSHEIADYFLTPKLRWELMSVFVGLAVFLGLSQPWQWVGSPLAVYASGVDRPDVWRSGIPRV